MNADASPRLPGPYYPLQGLRVIEFCWVWAGPFLGQFLADLGAEVIKIEWHDRFDPYRTRGIELTRSAVPPKIHREMSPSFHNLNRNKVGFAVNLKSAEGIDLVKQLAAKSDVVIENWSAGTLGRLGLGYEALAAVNPQLLMLSLSAIGPSSRLRDMRSYGLVTSAMGGAEAAMRVGDEIVGSPTFNVSDPNAAVFGLLGIVAGMIEVGRRGRGFNLVVSQLEAVMSLMSSSAVGDDPDLVHGVYPTADDRFVAVSVPALGDAAELASWCRRRTAAEVEAGIGELGGYAAVVTNVMHTHDAPVFQDLEVHVGAQHPVTGAEALIAAPWRINGRRAPVRKPAPLMAEGNTYVLRSVLGLSDAAIEDLHERNVA